jgi:hypothetical protein
MQELIIQVNQIEELQTIKDTDELDRIFKKAQSTIVQGEAVVLVRKNPNGEVNTVEQLTTEADLAAYKQQVLKYL